MQKQLLEQLKKLLIENNRYIGEIPGNFMQRDEVEYYLLLELNDQEDLTFPFRDASNNPFIINVDRPVGANLDRNPNATEKASPCRSHTSFPKRIIPVHVIIE